MRNRESAAADTSIARWKLSAWALAVTGHAPALSFGIVAGLCLGATWFPHQRMAALCALVGGAAASLLRTRAAPSRALAESSPAGGLSARPSPSAVGVHTALGRAERWAPLVILPFFVPLLTHVVAPGADMAMHAALARALRDDLPVLSPAWGDVRADAYPLGFSAWIAVLGSFTGIGTASVLASASAFALYYVALQGFVGRALQLAFPRLLSAFLLTASWTPQAFYRWGGGPSVLAMALALYAAAEIPSLCDSQGVARAARSGAFVALLLMAAVSTHPIGASLGAACCAVVWLKRCTQQLRAALRGWVFVAFVLVMGWLGTAGPEISAREHAWIAHFQTVDENVLGDWPRYMFPLTVWRAVFVRGGPVIGVCFLLSCVALWRRQPRVVWRSVLSIEALGALLAYGPELPGPGILIYPSRLMPAAILLLASPLAAALQLAHEQLRARARQVGGAVLATSALCVHVGLYQMAQPMVTSHDAAALRCLAQQVPDSAVVEGAYGDATQWIPALTGRAITRPHVHCSLFDEVDAQLADQRPTHRFVGERVCFGAPLDTPWAPSVPICQRGGARLHKLAAQ